MSVTKVDQVYQIAGVSISTNRLVNGFDDFKSANSPQVRTRCDDHWLDPGSAHLNIERRGNSMHFIGDDGVTRGSMNVEGTEATLSDGVTLPYLLRSAWHYSFVIKGGVAVHAAGIVDHRNRGWLIPGPSGAGKSTFASRFDQKNVISEEIVAVKDGQLHATPFRMGGCRTAKLHGILFIEQGTKFSWRPCSSAESLLRLVPESPWATDDPLWGEHLLTSLHKLTMTVTARVVTFSLACDLGAELEKLPNACE